MKEIKVSDHSTLPRIVGDQVTIQEAKKRCHSGCMIMTIVNNTWYQLITLPETENGFIIVREQHHSSERFMRTWDNNTIEQFIQSIIGMYPNTEFYLIESMQDIFQILKERIPQWLPIENQNV